MRSGGSYLKCGGEPLPSLRLLLQTHLVPLGEYVPFRDFLGSVPDVLGAAMFVFTPGRQAHVLNSSETPLGVFISYEAVLVPKSQNFCPKRSY